MKNHVTVFCLLLSGILLSGAMIYGSRGRAIAIDKYDVVDRPARIYPDYGSTVIPPNIAPLNFMVKEEGSHYYARIYSDKGKPIEVFSNSAKIQIPADNWHGLLEQNRGNELRLDIFVRKNNEGWVRFNTITNKIANEDIDGFLVFRRMHPTHILRRGRIGIYQRNLANFDEKVVLDNRRTRYTAGCVNCHTFCRNKPDEALIGVRTRKEGDNTLLIEPQAVNKLSAKFGYTSWHPSGKLAVYSINNLPMVFHTAGEEVRDTVDMNSALAYFVVDSKTVKTSPQISRKDFLETWPAWSGDGRYLYFCTSPITWTDQNKVPPDGYKEIKYDLVRISYDIEHDKWGELETVLSAKDTGRSIAMPRISPDGRWLIFCMCEYGYFPPWQPSSDLYIMDLKAGAETGKSAFSETSPASAPPKRGGFEYHRLEINSDQSEAWHSWSSNSRWIVFSSKRDFGPFTKSYISYVDENGRAYKPIVVPQKDPEFYDFCLEAFNTPELAAGPIAVNGEKLASVVYGSAQISVEVPITMATPKAGTTPKSDQDWQELQ